MSTLWTFLITHNKLEMILINTKYTKLRFYLS